jgi:hypothetical protein
MALIEPHSYAAPAPGKVASIEVVDIRLRSASGARTARVCARPGPGWSQGWPSDGLCWALTSQAPGTLPIASKTVLLVLRQLRPRQVIALA